ncbi:GNAT family N-acetyltransferase [Aquamicrobium sp.]|uniref:GNAT family N-acetyltransferase n=1 Tax=Aquamicrobium sp. TaxID=1872579 RepID=UPI002584F175|nr:GNAT family N-acetyltransferase [Aquamicrobium sp.]MCK9553888.1 GNAT family N-acetyltransferase [Aquamicrobium sp.]
MLRYEWFVAAERHLAQPDSVRVLHVLDDGNLAAALALERVADSHGHTRYQILGHARLYEPTDLLYCDDSARRLLVRAAASLRHPVVLSRLWPHTTAVDKITAGRRLCSHAIELTKPVAASQYLRLEGDYDTYSRHLSSRHRYDIRRAYRRAAEIGQLAVQLTQPGPAEVRGLLDVAFAVEARSWKGVQGSSVVANTDLQAFFHQVLGSYAAEGYVLTALLSIDAVPAAMQVCLVAHGKLWMLKIGYDEAFKRVSPGLILMNEVIRYAHQNSLCGIEFLGSAEAWLDVWSPERREYRLVALYPYTLPSLAYLGRDLTHLLLRRTRNTLFPERGV